MVFRFLLTWLLIDVCWTLVEWRHYGELVSSSSKPTMFVCLCGPTIVFLCFFLHFLVFPLMYIFQQPLYPKLIPKSESNLCNVFNRSLSCQFNTWSALIWTTHIFLFREHLVLRPRYLWRVFWSNCRQTKASNSWTCQPLGERPKWKN